MWTFYIPRDSPLYSEGLSSIEVVSISGTDGADGVLNAGLLFRLVST